MWVLFESKRSIGEKLYATLIQLMPSVDQIFISNKTFREKLQGPLNLSAKNEVLKFHSTVANPQYSAASQLSLDHLDLNDENNNFSMYDRFNHGSLSPNVFNRLINYDHAIYPYLKVEKNYSYVLNLNFTGLISQMQANHMLFDGG